MLLDDDENIWDDEDSESGPAFDEPDTLPQPRMATSVAGHDAIERQLLDMLTNNRMPQAMIFAGLQGIGKATMAYRVAKFLLTHKPVVDAGPSLFGDPLPAATQENFNSRADDPAVRLVLSGGHPDLLVIERKFDEEKGKFKDVVDVEQLRQIPPFLQLTPAMGGWRIVIIDDADTMNRNSQNALLKVLEEPPANAILILVAHRPGQLIPTIRSRSRYFEFSTPDRATFDSLIKQSMPSMGAAEMAAIYNISGGSIGAALRLMQEGALKSITQLSSLLQPWPNIVWTDVHMMGEVLGGKGNDDSALQGFQDVMIWTCEQMAKCRARGTALPPPINTGPFPAMLNHFSLMEWSKICDDLRTHFATVKYGTLDKRQAVFGAFSILRQAS